MIFYPFQFICSWNNTIFCKKPGVKDENGILNKIYIYIYKSQDCQMQNHYSTEQGIRVRTGTRTRVCVFYSRYIFEGKVTESTFDALLIVRIRILISIFSQTINIFANSINTMTIFIFCGMWFACIFFGILLCHFVRQYFFLSFECLWQFCVRMRVWECLLLCVYVCVN